MIALGGGWDEALAPLFADERYKKIREFLKYEYSHYTVYPDMYDLYNCFRFTPLAELKAVILGQDPYHEPGQAHGLCFSVKAGVQLPPSLKNIYKEIYSDLGIKEPDCGDLTKWAKEGVLLLNTTLTVREHRANSHAACGWAWFTDSVIKLISDKTENTVFILWGGNARSKKPLIDRQKHLIIESAHPSPLSAYNGFFDSRPFSKCNDYLVAHGKQPIDWDLN
ncbi:MAG TPA: uracil-DNA glycosylase [Candidatus Coproplasma excrementigallinarum]|uniref:Uracil-DNA glycosylase n=1 Tax=Candidatus Coproplasma excrementigallinarum TaxID=2840747 RepID=A0A9D1ML35_9FIRM|nr:uracil-DNA glycosylase [Candidatus Coproplasma excrementigallinarum]